MREDLCVYIFSGKIVWRCSCFDCQYGRQNLIIPFTPYITITFDDSSLTMKLPLWRISIDGLCDGLRTNQMISAAKSFDVSVTKTMLNKTISFISPVMVQFFENKLIELRNRYNGCRVKIGTDGR